MASHFEAAKGAYIIRDFKPGKPKMGTVFVQGTSTTNNLVQILPELDSAGLNVKVVAAISPQLFAMQDAAYRDQVASLGDRWDAMVVSNRSRRVSRDWIAHKIVADYSLTSDWDDRWRTGGTLEEVIAEGKGRGGGRVRAGCRLRGGGRAGGGGRTDFGDTILRRAAGALGPDRPGAPDRCAHSGAERGTHGAGRGARRR